MWHATKLYSFQSKKLNIVTHLSMFVYKTGYSEVGAEVCLHHQTNKVVIESFIWSILFSKVDLFLFWFFFHQTSIGIEYVLLSGVFLHICNSCGSGTVQWGPPWCQTAWTHCYPSLPSFPPLSAFLISGYSCLSLKIFDWIYVSLLFTQHTYCF